MERLLIAEDDNPMRLVAVALGAPLDARMRSALDYLFAGRGEEAVERLRGLGGELGLAGRVTADVATTAPLDDQLAEVDYLLVENAPVARAGLAKAPRLRLIQKFGCDASNVDLTAAAEHGVPVARLRRWANSSVAEQTLLLMLAVARRLGVSERAAREPQGAAARGASRYNWAALDSLRPLRGATLGIVGLGEIGREVARRARTFDMRVLYSQRHRCPPEVEDGLGVEFRLLPALLAESDFVTLHVPLTPATHHLLGAAELKQMRRGAVLINTSRGRVVDEAALAAALREGQLGGAGLDVRHDEPPADSAAFAGLDSVVLTPHVAGGTGAEILADAREVLENVARVRRGDPVETRRG